MKALQKLRKGNRKGIALIWLAFLLPLLLFLAGMGIDLAYMFNAKNQLQVAADSAALAGAATLDCTNDILQSVARNEAQKFAAQNTVVGDTVTIDLNNNNSPGGDIVLGNWNASLDPKFEPSGARLPINAVKVVTQKNVNVFIGKVFTLIGFDWSVMHALAEAIAVKPPLSAPPLTLCTGACALPPGAFPALFDIQTNFPTGSPGSEFGISWTLFNQDASVPNNLIEDLINGRSSVPPDLCITQPCITTNNGVFASLNVLGDKFRDVNWDPANKVVVGGVVQSWTVRIIVLDLSCPSSASACPPTWQGSGSEPYHIWGWARANITQVCDNSSQARNDPICGVSGAKKGIALGSLTCVDCSSTFSAICGDNAQLVK